MGRIRRARCSDCGERERLHVIAETPGNQRSRKFTLAWLYCQVCGRVFSATDWGKASKAAVSRGGK